jgi:hypothetical protein
MKKINIIKILVVSGKNLRSLVFTGVSASINLPPTYHQPDVSGKLQLYTLFFSTSLRTVAFKFLRRLPHSAFHILH